MSFVPQQGLQGYEQEDGGGEQDMDFGEEDE